MPRPLPLLAILLLAGCTRQADPDPKTAAPAKDAPNPVVAAETPTPASKPAPPAPVAPTGPATSAEALAVIDLRKIAKLPGAQVKIARPNQLIYAAPSTLADAGAFHRARMLELGWSLDKTPNPKIDPKEYVFDNFDRAGFRVSLSASKSRDKEGQFDINLSYHGNVDVRTLPRLTDAKPVYNNWHYASYKTDAKPAEILAFYRNALPPKGWREHRVSGTASFAKEDRHLLGFSQNAIVLFFNIKGDKDGPTNVESSVSVKDRPEATPVDKLPEAVTFADGKKIIDLNRFPRIEGPLPGQGSSAELTYLPPGSVADAIAFYRKKLTEAGWTEDDASSQYDGTAHLYFTKSGFTLSCDIRKDFREPHTVVHLVHCGNVMARDMPRVADASERTQGSPVDIGYETETPIAEIADFYKKELTPHGWKELSNKTNRDGSRTLEFRQNAITMLVEIGDGRVRVRSNVLGDTIPRPNSESRTLQTVDLRRWPRFKKAAAKKVDSATLEYAAAGNAKEVTEFHRTDLRKNRWQELPSRKDDPAIRFDRDGFVVELRVALKGEECEVTAIYRGDVDLTRMFAPEDAEVDGDSVTEDAKLTTSLSPDAVAAFYKAELPHFGWKQVEGKTPLEFSQRLVRFVIDIGPAVDGETPVRLRSWGLPSNAP